MTVHLTHHATTDGQVVLRATGDLDALTTPHLARAVDTLVGAGARRLVLDLTDLDFLDSTALGALVPRLRALREIGGDMVVAAAKPMVVRVITDTGTDAVLAVVPSVADAEGVIELRGARSRRQTQVVPTRPAARQLSRKAS